MLLLHEREDTKIRIYTEDQCSRVVVIPQSDQI